MALEAQTEASAGFELTSSGEQISRPNALRQPTLVQVVAFPTVEAAPTQRARQRSGRSRVQALAEALARALRGVRYLVQMVSDHALSRSYWPDSPRKSKPRVFAELLWWLVRYGEINHFYYLFGLDRKDAKRDDVMSYRAFRNRRNRLNLRVVGMPYNYVCVLRDKFLFSQFLQSLGVPTPRNLALLDRATATWLDTKQRVPLVRLTNSVTSRWEGFCKPIDGTHGQGAFPLCIEEGRISTNGVELSSDQLIKMIDGRFLFQERIQQHPAMSALHPASVNTVRIITFFRNGKPTVFCASARMGTGGRAVDNWSAGGLTIGVDAQTGEFQSEAFFKPGYGGRIAQHPDTGVVFEGLRVPHFQEAVQLVLQLHEYLPQIHSIGWDIAISTRGPVVIEGNDDWHGIVPMLHERDVRRRLHAMLQRDSAQL
jgi:hypothetical protein